MPSEVSRRSFLIRWRFLDGRDDDVGRVHPLGEIPQPLAPDAPGDRDLPAHHQELEHLGDVAVVRPPGRGPRHHAGVRDVARAQRPGAAEQLEDVAPEAVVVADPRVRALVAAARPAAREDEAEVAHRPNQRVVLEQRAVLLEGLLGGRPAGRSSRGGSRRRGRRWARSPQSGRSAAGSAAARLRADRSAEARRAVARAPRCAGPVLWSARCTDRRLRQKPPARAGWIDASRSRGTPCGGNASVVRCQLEAERLTPSIADPRVPGVQDGVSPPRQLPVPGRRRHPGTAWSRCRASGQARPWGSRRCAARHGPPGSRRRRRAIAPPLPSGVRTVSAH